MPSYEATVKFKILSVNSEGEAQVAARKAASYLPNYVQVSNHETPIFLDEYPTVSIISNKN